MMQMLAAGGMTLLTDYERRPDIDNPRGYCEWEPIKLLPKEPQRIDEAEGKVQMLVKQRDGSLRAEPFLTEKPS